MELDNKIIFIIFLNTEIIQVSFVRKNSLKNEFYCRCRYASQQWSDRRAEMCVTISGLCF